jgi:hypothetical protein
MSAGGPQLVRAGILRECGVVSNLSQLSYVAREVARRAPWQAHRENLTRLGCIRAAT